MASESSDEDVVGPMPAPAAGAGPHDARASAMTAARELAEREARQREAREREAQAASAPSARPDWMLQMPSADVAGVPAGALRARGFQQSRGRAQRVEGENAEEAARLWTETPEERRTRIVQSKGGSALPQHHESDAERRARERAAVRDAAMREQAQALVRCEDSHRTRTANNRCWNSTERSGGRNYKGTD